MSSPSPNLEALSSTPATGWKRTFPGLELLSKKGVAHLPADLLAAITLAAYLIPAGIGDASLAGLPPQAGLYACLFGGLVFWMFCSSRHTAITVTSAISLLIGTSLGELSGGDPERHAALAACTAMLVAAIAFVAWAVRAGVLVNFISETVLLGFKAGVALHLTATQLPKLFGFKGAHGDFWERIWHFITHLGQTHLISVLVGASALGLILAGKKLLPNRPVALGVMVVSIAGVSWYGAVATGMALLGEVPSGLPVPRLPDVQISDLNNLLPLAMACFLLGAVETVAIGRTFALKHRNNLDANQEFLGLAASNLAAGLGSGFPISGGMSQSLVNESAGAKSPLSGLFAAGFVVVVAVALSGLLRSLPQPVLAAIVLAAVTGLLKVEELKKLWDFNRGEFTVAMAALAGVLCSGLLRGVLIGAVLSILMLLRRVCTPHTAELGRVPGTDFFADRERHPENRASPGVFIFRVDASLVYFNAEYVRDRFLHLLSSHTEPVKLAVFYLGTSPLIDLAGASMLMELHGTLSERGIRLELAEAHGSTRDSLRRLGYERSCGPVHANRTVLQILSSDTPEAV